MPNRILKESICTSDEIDGLTAFQETVFYRLIVNCDDYGRMDARPSILASKLFPLKRTSIRESQIEDALRALTSADLVKVYRVHGKPILQMNTWDRHQTIRAKTPKYPGPEEAEESGMYASASNCNQMKADASRCPRNPIQSNTYSYSESESNTRAGARETAAEEFERFWLVYPKKVGKKAAFKAFLLAVARKNGEPAPEVEELISAVERQKCTDQWQKEGGRYIPNPTTWLNQGRWADEPPAHTDGYQHHGEAMSPVMLEAVRRMMEEENNDER